MSIDVSHLVILGCSFSYGQGLDDPKLQAWPGLLSTKFNVPVVNLASKGGGNDRIMRKLFEYYYLDSSNNNPLYIVAFSHSSRREEYLAKHDDYRVVDLPDTPPTYHDDEFSWPTVMNYNQEIASSRKLMQQAYVLNFFKATNIKHILADFMPDNQDELSYIENTFPAAYDAVWVNPYKMIDLSEFSRQYTPLDCGHDGPEAQNAIANYLCDEITNRFGGINPVEKSFVSVKEYTDYYRRVGTFPGEDHWH